MNNTVVSMAHKRLGLLSTFAMLVLTVSIARGLAPIMTGNGGLAQPVYNLSAVLGILLSCCGLYLATFSRKQAIGPWPRILLVVNMALYFLWLLPVIVVKYDLTMISSFIYFGLFPFSVYGFIRLPEKKLISIAALLTLLVASYVIVEFSLINTQIIPGGYEKAFEQQQLLRPDEFEAYGRTGSMLRPNGLFGSRPHDTANFLAMVFVFWLAILLRGRNNKVKISFLVILSLVGLFCTQSASNILAALAGAVFVLFVYRRNMISFRRIIAVVILVMTALGVIVGLNYYGGINLESLWTWYERINPESGDWRAMTRLGITYQWGDLYSLLFGHGSSLNMSQIGDTTEFAVLKILVEIGLVHWAIFFSLLSYPVALLFTENNTERRSNVVPYVAGVFVGMLSLWHYGSVMRTTNIFIFFALYAQVLRYYSTSYEQRKDAASPAKKE